MDEYPDFDEELEFERRHADEWHIINELEKTAAGTKTCSTNNIDDGRLDTSDVHVVDAISVGSAGSDCLPIRAADVECDQAAQSRSQASSTRGRKRDAVNSLFDADPVNPVVAVSPSSPEAGSPLSKRSRRGAIDEAEFPVRNCRVDLQHQLSSTNLVQRSDADIHKNRQKILRRIPIGGYVSLTSLTGNRVYLRLRSSKDTDKPDISLVGRRGFNLLQTSYDIMRLEIEQERELMLMQEIDGITNGSNLEAVTVNSCGQADVELRSADLWVERFKPNNYLELLSDDGTNRNLLRWLKLWDKVVFGRDVKLRLKDQPNSSNNQFKYNHRGKNVAEVDRELDQWNRPNQKVALLSGPPGLGKTTLAHIIAKQAGYKAVEMNASDDRSAEAFKNQIEAATQMKSVMGQNPLPNCLIIDEIDGAPLTAINVLVSIITSKPVIKDGTTLGKKKRRKDHGFLRRPIICICNDQYAPALRPLRTLALLLNFPQTLSSRLASRLKDICHREKLKADLSTLLALCENQTNDIRSCLSTLQVILQSVRFVHNRKRELKMTDVCSKSVGQKDVQRSLFSVWQDIFRLPKQKRAFGVGQLVPKDAQTDGSSLPDRFRNTLSLAQCFGDYEKVNLGMFENYATVKYKDHNLSKASYGVDWLCFNDLFNQEIQCAQNYSIMTYLPFASVAFHLLFASASNTKIQFPSSHYEFVTKLTRSTNIIEAVVSDMQPSSRIYVTESILVLDLMPLLLDVICPTMRQVNTQLYSAAERIQLKQLINIMIAYSLVYRQQLEADGQYNYVLDHPIDLVAVFPGLEARKQLPYATKQLISKEIEQEKMKKRDTMATVSQNSPTDTAQPASTFKAQFTEAKIPLKLPIKEKPMKDFFGRTITASNLKTAARKVSPDNALVKTSDVWFHFKEGYSNAVRKNVTIESLL